MAVTIPGDQYVPSRVEDVHFHNHRVSKRFTKHTIENILSTKTDVIASVVSSTSEPAKHKDIDENVNQLTSGPPPKRRRRSRTVYTDGQLEALEKIFTNNQYPDFAEREQIATETDLPEARVLVWFQNKRARVRKSGGNGVSRNRRNGVVKCCLRKVSTRSQSSSISEAPSDVTDKFVAESYKDVIVESTKNPAASDSFQKCTSLSPVSPISTPVSPVLDAQSTVQQFEDTDNYHVRSLNSRETEYINPPPEISRLPQIQNIGAVQPSCYYANSSQTRPIISVPPYYRNTNVVSNESVNYPRESAYETPYPSIYPSYQEMNHCLGTVSQSVSPTLHRRFTPDEYIAVSGLMSAMYR